MYKFIKAFHGYWYVFILNNYYVCSEAISSNGHFFWVSYFSQIKLFYFLLTPRIQLIILSFITPNRTVPPKNIGFMSWIKPNFEQLVHSTDVQFRIWKGYPWSTSLECNWQIWKCFFLSKCSAVALLMLLKFSQNWPYPR